MLVLVIFLGILLNFNDCFKELNEFIELKRRQNLCDQHNVHKANFTFTFNKVNSTKTWIRVKTQTQYHHDDKHISYVLFADQHVALKVNVYIKDSKFGLVSVWFCLD